MTRNNVKIAITGGIGSGKSTVCKLIKEKGFPVISCDEVYSGLLKSADFLKVLQNEFGNVMQSDGSLDRKKLAEIVFNDSRHRRRYVSGKTVAQIGVELLHPRDKRLRRDL